MYHADYLIRTLQQFIVFLARLMGLKARNDPEVIQMELEAGLRQFLGLDLRLVEMLSDSSLYQLVANEVAKPEPIRIYIAIVLMMELAHSQLQTGFENRALLLLKKIRYFLDRLPDDFSVRGEPARGNLEVQLTELSNSIKER